MKTEDRLRAAINGVKTATSDVMKAQQRLRQLARGLREPAEARVAQ